jgi:hypothetical protein
MTGSRSRSRWETAAIWLYGLAALGIAARLLFGKNLEHNNVYLKVFAPAGEAFWARRDLYLEGSGFRYPPLVAALLGPFAACGPLLGSLLWRALNFAVLVLGLRALTRAGLPFALNSRERALVLGLSVLVGIGGLNNGQANALVLGCLLLGMCAARNHHAARAAGLVGAATALKVYPFAFGMVLATLRPRMWLWLGIALATVMLLPYAMAPWAYVTDQYRQLIDGLRAEDRTGDLSNAYRDLRLVLAACGVSLPPLAYLVLQGLGGLAIVLFARSLRQRTNEAIAISWATSATLCWMLLLGPSTEKVTYQLLTVPLALQLIDATRERSRARLAILGSALLLVIADITPWANPSREHAADQPWLRCLSPLAAILTSVDLTLAAVRPARSKPGAS